MDGGDSSSPPRAEAAALAQGLSQTSDQAAVRSVGSVVGQCPRENIGDSQLGVGGGGAQLAPGGSGAPPEVLAIVEPGAPASAAAGQLIGRNKRGRPPRGHTAAPKPPPPKRSKEEDEDVCFICFDGGSLVLCDRRGCPKAYHPACIKRDESFFRSRAKWNCGWHICSVCQKAAHYMCYTCTYSLCKGCTKDAEYVCVRGNKGFCTTCIKTIMLIENKDMGNKEVVQVDFDDKTSWEYLFKVYWLCLKDNLSLTIDELMQAKSPWRGVPMMGYKLQPPDTNYFTNVSVPPIPEKSSGNLEPNMPTEQLELPKHDTVGTEKPSIDNSITSVKPKSWASKELLELVAHMQNGDTSVLSEFDVQALLLEYIKINNLRDPHRKSQIVCDSRLKNIFGKPCVGHIEMLKLLEYHFLLKEDEQKNAFIPAGIVGSVVGHIGADQNNNFVFNLNKKRRTRKNCEENAPQINLDEYAAIDSHNIGLIYLQQNLMENLLGDEERFHDKVVGSFVRIRISSNDEKQDMYRLVQVVGTSKAAEPYKVVDKITNIMLEVLNLKKKETVSVGAISNQEFSQEECRRLRQSIRFGLVKQFTVGEIQTKAMALQELKLNDVLEAEITRFNHLRDRANEKGHKKDLRECVEKLQRLKMPEERQRRLTEMPIVHADPKMDPNYESEDDVAPTSDKKQGEFLGSKRAKFNKIGSHSVPPKCRAKEERPKRAQRLIEKRDAKHEMQVTVSSAPESIWGNRTVVKPSVASLSMGSSPAVNTSDMDKLWHYRDPNGKIQGPFAMVQLWKWSTTGYFPADMRIWTIDELNGSLLLTDALNRQLHKAYPLLHNVSRPEEVGPASNNSSLHSFNLKQNIASIVHQKNGYEGAKYKSVLNQGIQNSHETAMHQITGEQSQKPSNYQSHACQSSGENSRPLSLNLDLNHQDSNLASHVMPNDSTEDFLDLPSPTPKTRSENSEGQATEKQESRLDVTLQDAGISDLPTATPKPMNEEMSNPAPKEMQENLIGATPKPANEALQSSSPKPTDRDQGEQIAESQQSVPPKVFVPDSGPNWSSSLEVGGSQLQGISNEWAGYSSTDLKPPVEGWNSGLVAMSSVKPTDVLSEQVAAPSSNTNQVGRSTTTEPHAASNLSGWQAIVHEPIEFSALGEESVSDLLAEVDAMESQSGLASLTSATRYSDEMMDSCRNDCFSSIEELSPTPDAGKSDAVSPGEVQFPSQSPMADDPGVVSQADFFDSSKRSDGHSATSSEGETKPADIPLNPREPRSDVHPPAVCTSSQGLAPAPMSRNRGLELLDTGWHGSQGNMNMGWGGSPQGFPNIGWGPGLGGPWGNPNFNLGAYNASLGWDSPRRYGGERFAGPRDWGFQGPDPSFSRGRPMWSRQPHGGGSGGGGGYSWPPPKGQRVCKFYESGHCKKGASCDYLHP